MAAGTSNFWCCSSGTNVEIWPIGGQTTCANCCELTPHLKNIGASCISLRYAVGIGGPGWFQVGMWYGNILKAKILKLALTRTPDPDRPTQWEIFTEILNKQCSRLRWSMPPLLGLPTLCRTVANWNRSSDVLLGLHATDTTEQPVWQQWCTIWSGSHWRPGVLTNGWPCFIVCNITWCLLLDSWSPCSCSAVVQQKIGSWRSVSSSLCSDQCLQVLLLSSNCMHVEHSTSISDPFSFTLVL